MSIDLEYAIKKDIRNNPVVRAEDTRQTREFRRIVLLAALVVGLVLFSAWQHFQTLDASMRIERLRLDRVEEAQINRKLRLNVETLSRPDIIEARARRELGLAPARPPDTLVIERVRETAPSAGLMARAR